MSRLSGVGVMSRYDVDVSCDPITTGWACEVSVSERERAVSRHRVAVSAGDLARLAPGHDRPERLVEASFDFLLEHEPPGSILRSFDLPVIGRYFPEWEPEIPARLGCR